MNEDLCIFIYRENFKAGGFLRSLKKKRKSKLSEEYREPSDCRSTHAAMPFWQVGAPPFFPESIPAFREKSDLKGSLWARAAHRKVQGVQQGTGSSAEHGEMLRQGEGSTLVCIAPSHLPLTQQGTLLLRLLWAATLEKTVHCPRALSRGIEHMSEEEANHHCYMWQSVTSLQLSSLLAEHKCSVMLWLHYSHLEHVIQTVSVYRRLSA